MFLERIALAMPSSCAGLTAASKVSSPGSMTARPINGPTLEELTWALFSALRANPFRIEARLPTR
jgi:hypothetical protein